MQVMQQAALIQAQGLSKSYGAHKVLDELSLTLQPGTIVGLVGRNGAGKSTLLECLLGLCRVDGGQVQLFGKPAQQIDDTDKTELGYVPQKPDGFDGLSVAGMLELIASLYRQWDWQLAERLLQEWQLDPRQKLLSLSPGQRQQVALIRALAPRPRLLVLDEPASALDPGARRSLLREIVSLASEDGATVLFSTHIISDLERVASDIALLHGGRLLLHEQLDDLKEQVRRVYWPASQPLPAQPLPGELSRRLLPDGKWSLVVRSQAGTVPALPSGMQAHSLNLEDLFVELTA